MTVGEVFDFNYGGSNKLGSLETIKDANGIANIFTPRIQSYNFDGTLNTVNTAIAASSVLVGYKIYLNADRSAVSTSAPASDDEDFFVISKTDGSTSSYVKFTVIIDGVAREMPEILKTTNIHALREDWSNKSLGTSGWLITSEGNAIFTNMAVRGTIEATAGLIAGWSIDNQGLFASGGGLTSWMYPSGSYYSDSTVDMFFGAGPVGTRWIYIDNNSTTYETYFEVNGGGMFTSGVISAGGQINNASGGLVINDSSYFYSDITGAPVSTFETSTSNINTGLFTQYSTSQTSTVIRLNTARTAPSNATTSGPHFIRAYSGFGGVPDEEFQVHINGRVYGDNAYGTPTADYAEFFEWEDGNPTDEDRVGYSVSLNNNKIKIALPGEIPIGIISATPSIIGDSPWNRWKDKYLKDEYGRELYEACTIYQWKENGKMVHYFSDMIPNEVVVPEDKEVVNDYRKILNPDFNEQLEYIPRDDRKEWDTVGLLGKIRLRKGQITAPTWIKLRDISENVEEWLVR